MKNKIQSGRCIYSSLLLAACLASAQGKDMPMEKMTGGMPMMDMMGKFQQGCTTTSDTLDQFLKTVQDALKSDDKARMKVALEMAETHIMTMKGYMGQCTGMMDMLGNMMGGGMMGGKSGDAAAQKPETQPTTPGKTTPADKTDHEKHHPSK